MKTIFLALAILATPATADDLLSGALGRNVAAGDRGVVLRSTVSLETFFTAAETIKEECDTGIWREKNDKRLCFSGLFAARFPSITAAILDKYTAR